MNPAEHNKNVILDDKGLLCFWDFQESSGARRVAQGPHHYALREGAGLILDNSSRNHGWCVWSFATEMNWQEGYAIRRVLLQGNHHDNWFGIFVGSQYPFGRTHFGVPLHYRLEIVDNTIIHHAKREYALDLNCVVGCTVSGNVFSVERPLAISSSHFHRVADLEVVRHRTHIIHFAGIISISKNQNKPMKAIINTLLTTFAITVIASASPALLVETTITERDANGGKDVLAARITVESGKQAIIRSGKLECEITTTLLDDGTVDQHTVLIKRDGDKAEKLIAPQIKAKLGKVAEIQIGQLAFTTKTSLVK